MQPQQSAGRKGVSDTGSFCDLLERRPHAALKSLIFAVASSKGTLGTVDDQPLVNPCFQQLLRSLGCARKSDLGNDFDFNARASRCLEFIHDQSIDTEQSRGDNSPEPVTILADNIKRCLNHQFPSLAKEPCRPRRAAFSYPVQLAKLQHVAQVKDSGFGGGQFEVCFVQLTAYAAKIKEGPSCC